MLDLQGFHPADHGHPPGVTRISRHETLAKVIRQAVVPVIGDASPDEAVLVLKAVYKIGIRVAEIAMSGPRALTVLERVVDEFGAEMTFGAGSVLHADTARTCIQAGAEYIASPVFDRGMMDAVRLQSKAIIPGALTPTEVLTAWECHADAVRIFPCGAVGGPKYLASLKHTFPEIDMMPTGSLNLEATGAFLKAGACAVAVGKAFIDSRTIADGHYHVITERARRYLAEVAKARGA